MIVILELLRVKQYVKNALIFFPLFFSLNFIHPNKIIETVVAFFIFSLTASSIYIINDILDLEQDKNHPVKCLRPITSGKIKPKQALFLSIGLILTTLSASFLINKMLFCIILAYYLINICYSLKLKNVAIVDVFVIAVGFVLRILAGSVVIDVKPTSWIILLTFLLALFLAFSKRYDDVKNLKNNLQTRKNAVFYNENFLIATVSMLGAISIISYIMYTLSPDVTTRFASNSIYLTTFFVIFGIVRYLQLIFVENNANSCPTEILYTDKYIILSVLLWLCSFIILIYV